MFSEINTTPLSVVNSVPAILSAAEMLEDKFPDISGSFIQYATFLCEDYFSKNPSTPEVDNSMKDLQELNSSISEMSIRSNAKELEQFGDSVLAAADISDLPAEMSRLAYLAYASTSIYGKISDRVNKKMQKIQILLSRPPVAYPTLNQPQQNQPNSQIPAYPKLPDIPQEPVQLPSNGPINYPSLAFLKSSNNDISNSNGFHYPDIDKPIDNAEQKQDTRLRELIQIASVAFKNGSFKVAYAAMTAALSQLEA